MMCWQTTSGPNKAQGGDCPWSHLVGAAWLWGQSEPEGPPVLVGAVAVV